MEGKGSEGRIKYLLLIITEDSLQLSENTQDRGTVQLDYYKVMTFCPKSRMHK
jgi:hypothetical protein